MNSIDDEIQTIRAGTFSFSGVRPSALGATEYTLVTFMRDVTGSTRDFADELLESLKSAVEACRKSQFSENLLFRCAEFNTKVHEIHGFIELAKVDTATYQRPDPKGMTALYDATYAAVRATNDYARSLTDNDFNVNGIVFVVTDGDDTDSTQTAASVAEEITRGVRDECLESLRVILVGLNAQRYKAKLETFLDEAKLSQYVDIADATPKNLAAFARFVGQSVSSQAQSRGTGGPSAPVTW